MSDTSLAIIRCAAAMNTTNQYPTRLAALERNSKFERRLQRGRERSRRDMATTSKNMKGFYRQKKNTGGIFKSKSSKKSPLHAAALGSDVTQPKALVSHDGALDLKDDYDEKEEVLRQFDMNMAFGPCVGMSRLARWERAQTLGLNPPKEIISLLKNSKAQAECLWDGRV